MKASVREELVLLHNGSESLTLLHLSDLHLKLSRKKTAFLEKQIDRLHPELIVMTGDYYDTRKGASLFREFLVSVGRRFPVVFITGNHDHWFGRATRVSLNGIPGCHCVDDAVFYFTSPSGRTYTVTSWKKRNAAESPDDESKTIILVHSPEILKKESSDAIDLVLSGHLHGGQFIFHTTRSGHFFPGNLLYRFCTDRKQIDKTTLIVSRGLGDTLPFRFNCPKELVLIKIR